MQYQFLSIWLDCTQIPQRRKVQAQCVNIHELLLINWFQPIVSAILPLLYMKNHYFENLGLEYHQKRGTVIVTKFTPPYCSLLMASFKKTIFQNHDFKPFLWLRYIDNIFCIWFPNIKRVFQLYKQSASDNQIYHGLFYSRNQLFKCYYNQNW